MSNEKIHDLVYSHGKLSDDLMINVSLLDSLGNIRKLKKSITDLIELDIENLTTISTKIKSELSK